MIYSDPSTLQGIKEDIYFLGKCDVNTITDNDMQRIINKYYGQLQEVVRGVNENFYLAQATADLIAGDGTYSYPDGINGTAPAYEKMKSMWAAFLPADNTAPTTKEFQRVNCIDPEAISDPAYVFSTPTALLFGDYFILLPLTSDLGSGTFPVTGGLKTYYIAQQDQLTAAADVPKIFPSFHDAITQGSLIDVAERTGDAKLKADSVQLFAKRLKDIKAYASDHFPDDMNAIIEGQDTQGGWAYPWGQNSMS